MRKAYFVMGAESSGNRMMVDAIESSNDFGLGGIKVPRNKYIYKGKWDTEDVIYKSLMKNGPERLLYVASVPRGTYPNKEFPNIHYVCATLKGFNYTVYPIVMYRNREFVVKSQVERNHTTSELQAHTNIDQAYEHIFSELADIISQPLIVKYENLVNDINYRRFIFDAFDLNYPEEFKFFDANEKYKE